MAAAKFLNVDLDLESSIDLTQLIYELGESVMITANYEKDGIHNVSMELAGQIGSPDKLLNEYSLLFEGLSTEASEILSQCTERSFDFGYEGLPDGMVPTLQSRLSVESVLILAKLHATVTITTYWRPKD